MLFRVFLVTFVVTVLTCQVSAQYCTNAGPTSPQDSNLGPVSLDGVSDNIDNKNNCPGEVGVQDFTSSQKADLALNDEYTVNFDVTSCGAEYNRRTAIWIDWNSNQVFESDEQIVFTSGVNQQKKTFTVPDNAVLATTRMRVMVQETNSPTLDPCAAYPYGGVKDFSIEVIASAGLSGGWWFIIILLICFSLYCCGGYAYNMKVLHKEGNDRVPHLDFWKDLPGLVKDGVSFFTTWAKEKMGKGGPTEAMSGGGQTYDEY